MMAALELLEFRPASGSKGRGRRSLGPCWATMTAGAIWWPSPQNRQPPMIGISEVLSGSQKLRPEVAVSGPPVRCELIRSFRSAAYAGTAALLARRASRSATGYLVAVTEGRPRAGIERR